MMGQLLFLDGSLRAAHNTALGTTTGDTTVASGAALELIGGITIASGEDLTLVGTGEVLNRRLKKYFRRQRLQW